MKATGFCEGWYLCATGQRSLLCCPAVFTAWLNVDHVTMSGAVCMQTWVCALSCSALLSSHNQWPFSLRWWMRDKCSASKHVSLSLSLFLSPSFWLSLSFSLCFLCSHPYTCWAPEGQQLTLLSAYAAYMCTLVECRLMHMCLPVQSYDSPSLPPTSAWFAVAITHRSCRSSICGWCWVLSLVCVPMCILSPGQSEEWDSRL